MSTQRFAFGSFLFDDGRRLLFEHGTPVSVGQRALALLGTLLAAGNARHGTLIGLVRNRLGEFA